MQGAQWTLDMLWPKSDPDRAEVACLRWLIVKVGLKLKTAVEQFELWWSRSFARSSQTITVNEVARFPPKF